MGKLSRLIMNKVAVTFELCGTGLSREHFQVIEHRLSQYSEQAISTALDKCLDQVRGRLSIADIIDRIPHEPNERPGPDEAWASLTKTVAESVCWTAEQAEACALVSHLLDIDPVAARMAFREAYNRLCQAALDRGDPVVWSLSVGTSKSHRAFVIQEAIRKKRLKEVDVQWLTPELPPAADERDVLPAHEEQGEDISEYITHLKEKMKIRF